MKKLVVFCIGIVLILGCGGARSIEEPEGAFIRIDSFTVKPDTVSLGQEFTISASYDYESDNGLIYIEIPIEEQGGYLNKLSFFCGNEYMYGCVKSFTVRCIWFENDYGKWLRCTDPLGSNRSFVPEPGTYTLTLRMCVVDGLEELCETATARLTLQ